MATGKVHVQSCGLFWLLSNVYLVHAALVDTKYPTTTDAVFNLIIRRPRFAGGNLSIPIDSNVRLVKCSRKEAPYNTIRLRYGKTRKCVVIRASDSLEREKWLVGIIQAMAAAQNLGLSSTILDSSTETASETASWHQSSPMKEPSARVQLEASLTMSSVDTISSSADRLDNFIPLLQHVSNTSSVVADIDVIQHRSSVDQARSSSIIYAQRRRVREHVSAAV
ncbi:hypothetical protein F441_11199 [Phytophthora nicotianae CJ01A1]|uniref:PH domain-containing protein n=5 Tax=Phytophthora nicotianae TaxID=4792 RepID=V9EXG6_PHYNI|nr:hypothetical protein F443_11275 [Phytophthora nicotianae P1569]ETL90561.1 hypothetical protein L917_10788 [Phytophthora nicotianae]ETP13748.1 hypothetical protein F441_11199 [Phytophthora nicotianae CJ01A1]ETP41819.1 hypothetical protein F442_11185 [Phytophthora nicotianae P10297]